MALFGVKKIFFLNSLKLPKGWPKNDRIFQDIEQNSFDTYPPYKIMTNYIKSFKSFLSYLPTFMYVLMT